ncbi:sigma 54-interacting transcriptional regulator [Chitinophaga filiformis]|uniref:sigma-54-dependent Fis family transcriptional regulator n=1 Tax=Chitinophaga filiformis TaxID=104663 RepID=UPI001F1E4167|nr:sigma 54-interacting transcriptional regulator [Chitinophaga filiformis]MCF6402803.1 sigma 54-interacting transcriptional regulator [Chitinophaga filiformis]MCF6403279.1 sigma 54-interacting transcriptional regulator [Chitinophaga filiformis]
MEKESTPKQTAGLYIPDSHFLVESLEQQKREQAVLLELSSTIAGAKSRQDLRAVITDQFPELFGGRYYTLCLINEDGVTHSPFLHSEQTSIPSNRGETPIIVSRHPINDGIFEKALASEEPVLIDLQTAIRANTVPQYVYRWFNAGIREMLLVKISGGGIPIGVLYLYGEKKGSFQIEKFRLFKGIADILGAGFGNIIFGEKIEQQLREIRKYKGQPEDDEDSLHDKTAQCNGVKSIIGTSPAIQNIVTVVERIAPSDSTVLLLGETGTGKEVIANAIHAASPRRNNRMIKINCAALPHSLFESELFGHEKGAFTGALQRRIGKFELAENSTLFLDEIGEIPLEFQAKLLRVLQEKEIERIGGKGVIKVNVRIIAATNRNLEEEVKAGNFRHDLYYRLNVVPISVPPLRNRKEDVPALVTHFLRRYATINKKKAPVVPDNVMESLMHHDWPGNVRELEHLLERSILLSKGNVLQIDFHGTTQKTPASDKENAFSIVPLEIMEREYILKVVRLCNGRIAGPNGAAAKLRLPSTTLNSRMQKLGIKKEHFNIRQSSRKMNII